MEEEEEIFLLLLTCARAAREERISPRDRIFCHKTERERGRERRGGISSSQKKISIAREKRRECGRVKEGRAKEKREKGEEREKEGEVS